TFIENRTLALGRPARIKRLARFSLWRNLIGRQWRQHAGTARRAGAGARPAARHGSAALIKRSGLACRASALSTLWTGAKWPLAWLHWTHRLSRLRALTLLLATRAGVRQRTAIAARRHRRTSRSGGPRS